MNKRLKYALDVSQDVMIPKSDDVISGFFQHLGPRFIFRGSLGMLPTVDLDDQLQVQRDKIHYVARDRFLPFELDAIGSCLIYWCSFLLTGFIAEP